MNDKTPPEPRPQQSASRAMVWALVLSSMISTPVMSATTDISSSPITSTNAAQVKPNIMLLMDTSYSMGWTHMPDEVEAGLGFQTIGYKAAECNVLYYNRNQVYALPKKADGSLFPTPSFTSSLYDAFKTPASASVDLSGAFKAYDDFTLRTSGDNDFPQAAYYYYKTGGTVPITNYASSPCRDNDPLALRNLNGTPASSDGGLWHRVLVSTNSGPAGADETTNFAIWYSYYRTRILLIKSAASLAFTPLTDSFRVGFITVRPKDDPTTPGPINPDKYLAIDDFTATQRGLWYDKLFAQRPAGSSPTREGLARVGRHYAGQHDGINTGMDGDPVQFSCQQNFTIMTTDGYWNAQEESTNVGGSFIGGGVDISGKALVGQRDGALNSFSTNSPSPPPAADVNVTPRPIWDGTFDGLRTIRTNTNHYEYKPCGAYYRMTTTTLSQSTSQLQARTVQTTQSTLQTLQSTSQRLQSTVQTLRATSQSTQSTFQSLKSTRQNLATSRQRVQTTQQTTASTIQYRQTTNQNLQSTTQNLQSSSQSFVVDTHPEANVWTPLQSTVQNLRSTTQTLQSTSQQNQGTVQNLQTTRQNQYTRSSRDRVTTQTLLNTSQTFEHTEQNLQSTSQLLRRTAQTTQSSVQISATTVQLQASTLQNQLRTYQTTISTRQDARCDALGENCVPTATGSCVQGGGVTCETRTTGPTLVVYNGCTNDPPNAGNSFRATICNTVYQPTVAALSCTFDPATAANSYTTTDCPTPITSGPTLVASCNNIAAALNNQWTATTCTPIGSGPTYVASCSVSGPNIGNSFTATSCFTDSQGPTGVQTCNPQTGDNTNNYLTITCGTNNTPDTGVQTCPGSSAGNAGNSWVTTTCTPVTTTNVPVTNCTTSPASALNGWLDTVCAQNNSTPIAVQTCNPIAAGGGNSYTATLCVPTTSSNPSGTCVVDPATNANSWTSTTCPSSIVTTTLVPWGSCSAVTGNAGNSWTTTSCPLTVAGPFVYSLACFAPITSGAYYFVCSPNDTVDVPVVSCTPSGPLVGNGYTTTTCRQNASALTPVASCTPIAADITNTYTATICPVITTTNVGVMSCTPAAVADNTNSYTVTTCTPNNTSLVPVLSCTNSGPNAGNGFTDTVCSNNNTSNVAVASCTPQLPSGGNGFTTTTCPPEIHVSGPTAGACSPVAASAGNGFQRTDCTTVVNPTAVQNGTCVPDPPNGITCTTVTQPNVPVQTCTPQTAAAGNGWIDITCGTNDQPNVPVLACAASGPTAANLWTTTTCPAPITTGPAFVASCSVIAAALGNNWISTACPAPITTGPTGVQTCAFIPGDNTNNYQTTTCAPNNSTMPVQTCVDAVADGTNQWTATTCADNDAVAQPVVACAPQTAALANGWVTITCPPAIVTTNQVAASCVDDPTPTPVNAYTTTTCTPNNVLNTPTGSCVPMSPDNTNGYTTTTCPVVTTPAIGAIGCVAQTGDGTNSWLTITCTPNNTTDVGVQTCNNSGPNVGNGQTTTSCRTDTTTDVAVATCNAGPGTGANFWLTTSCRPNNNLNVPTQNCSPVSPDNTNGFTTTTCPVIDSGVIGAASCTASGPNAGNFWTTTTCPGTATTGPTPANGCVGHIADNTNSWTATVCSTVTSPETIVATCNPGGPVNGVTTNCTFIAGQQLNTTNYVRTQVFNVSGGAQAGVVSDNTAVTGPTASGACYAPTTAPTLPTDGYVAWTSADATAYPSCSGWPCTIDTNTSDPHSVNSLADVAQYYYVTDLRTPLTDSRGINYTRDDVPGVGAGPEDDRVRWQHMTTFSIALGVSGSLQYQSDYKTASLGDFAHIRTGSIPVGDTSGTGATNWPLWPDPALDYVANPTLYNNPRSIDDFWHAAVNGRGTYFSAGNPTSVIAGLAGALAGITSRVASSTGAGTSNLEPVAGDNFVYLANYTTQKWTGDVQAHEIDVGTGVVQNATLWSAQTILDGVTHDACDNRKIKLFRAGAITDNLVNFSWNTSACDGSGNPTGSTDTGLNATEKLNFAAANIQFISQWPSMTVATPDQHAAAAGANMVNFLRGQRGFETFVPGVANKLYRAREHVLGDIIDGQPVYVRSPFTNYADANYAAFKSGPAATRPAMLYVAANDGMLHAFYAGSSAVDPQGGKEAWAFIPTLMLPKLYKLADANYANIHEYYVDGTPSVTDVDVNGGWRTMLVGGLNAGGKGYYALDVTDPANPKGMWEFNYSDTCYDPANTATFGADCHLGLSFGKPVITKLADDRWVVMVTSGYNNINANPTTGEGVGYLYVLDAGTGQIIYKISTGTGDRSTPSGLAQINNFVDKPDFDNKTVRVYGTDVLGNIWRFDVNDLTLPAGRDATLIGTAMDAANNPQPITVRPELTLIGANPMLFVATGKLLGATDSASVQTQSVYGIIDPLTATPFASLRGSLAPLRMTQVGSGPGAYRTVRCTGTAAQCGSAAGWYVDLPDTGERVNVEMKLRAQTLIIGSNVPIISACSAGGYSWLNFLNYKSGLAVQSAPNSSVSVSVANSLIVGLTVIKLSSGGGGSSLPLKGIVTTSDAGVLTFDVPNFIAQPNPKRISWREVLAQ